MKYFKFLTKDAKGTYSGFDYKTYLPKNGKPGKWLPAVKSELEKCERGYHACKEIQILDWLNERMFEVEFKNKPRGDNDKVWGDQIRIVRELPGWNEKNQRLAACDIAESVMKYWNKKYPKDTRPQDCIDTARKYANGKATKQELAAARSAAWDAAGAAAGAAARAAAGAAAWAAARAAAWDAAGAAARAAAWDAAGAAARAAAWDAALKKNIKIVMKYAEAK